MNPKHFGSDPADVSIRIRINPEIRSRIPDHSRQSHNMTSSNAYTSYADNTFKKRKTTSGPGDVESIHGWRRSVEAVDAGVVLHALSIVNSQRECDRYDRRVINTADRSYWPGTMYEIAMLDETIRRFTLLNREHTISDELSSSR